MKVETLGDDFDAGDDGFMDTAAVMESLDLVITTDTSIAHLAGALGRLAFVAVNYAPCWRWLLNRSDTMWYPTLTLFRQKAPGNWSDVFAEIEARTVQLIQGSPMRAGSPLTRI
jgi:ADP-heptose:LPS heptosyltransferase